METGHSTVATEPHAVAAPVHDAHDEFYAVSNPKYFGLPLGVLLATAVSAAAVGITLLKFFGAWL